MDLENPNIVKLTMEHSDIVYEYMKTEFAPDEPLLRTCDGMNGTSFSDKMVQGELREKFINKGIHLNFSAKTQDLKFLLSLISFLIFLNFHANTQR